MLDNPGPLVNSASFLPLPAVNVHIHVDAPCSAENCGTWIETTAACHGFMHVPLPLLGLLLEACAGWLACVGGQAFLCVRVCLRGFRDLVSDCL